MAGGLAMQHRFAAEPMFSKIRKGFLISGGLAELERLKASLESDRRQLSLVSGRDAAGKEGLVQIGPVQTQR